MWVTVQELYRQNLALTKAMENLRATRALTNLEQLVSLQPEVDLGQADGGKISMNPKRHNKRPEVKVSGGCVKKSLKVYREDERRNKEV